MNHRSPGLRGVLAGAALVVAAGLAASSLLPGPAALAAAPTPAVAQAPAAPAPAAATSYADLVERVAPAVVTIRTAQVVRTAMPDDFFHRFFRDRRGGSEPPAQRRGGLGSGVVVSEDGYILTNHHVVEGAQTITVELSDRRQLEAELVGSDPPSDLAVLKVNEPGLATLPLGDSDEVRVGDVVLAFGNPLGVGQTVTSGIISAKGRATGIADGSYEDFLQTDAPINRGSSGGPLVSVQGELIGINTQILSQTGGNIGIGFAIPSDMAADVMRQLVENGRVRRGRLGVTVQAMTSDLAESFGLEQVGGALVNDVDGDGPASAAGLEIGDVILAVDGETVRHGNDLRNRIAHREPGSRVRLEVLRDGDRHEVQATLGEMGASEPDGGAAPDDAGEGRYGMTVAPLTPETARRLGTDAEAGIVVSGVDPAGRAAAAGIQRGDVILEVGRRPVTTVDELQSALDAAGDRPALVRIERGGTALFLTLSR